ncbi:MAG: PilZ domain-containing protein [Bdellovibrionaceae bacterium]|nr:PilZ domain-containing protein [Pseudobdellovibrionaceae bacterium]
MGKVIDITDILTRRKSKVSGGRSKSQAEVLDMTGPRSEELNEERRKVRRTILTGFVGAFVVVPDRGLLKVSLFDINENGLSFDTEMECGHFNREEKVAMRIYLNHKTYFEFLIEIKWFEQINQVGVIRHGARFVKNSLNQEALHHFVKFIEAVSVNLQADEGDVQISTAF